MNKLTLTDTSTVGRDTRTVAINYEFDDHPDFTVIEAMAMILNDATQGGDE